MINRSNLLSRSRSRLKLPSASDAHEGLKQAISAVFQGASWQRFRVHFMRNILSHVPKAAQQMVATSIRSIFLQQNRKEASSQLARVATGLAPWFPRVAQLLEEAEEESLACMSFPGEHWRQLYSTNPVERLNKEIKRRTDVVGIFPRRQSVIRLAGSVLAEQDDEWAVGWRYFSQESMKKLYQQDGDISISEFQLARMSSA